jgi:hypothetical protein
MSPKSRGRPAGRGRAKPRRQPVREVRLSDRVLRDARRIEGAQDVLDAEVWASDWLGQAWLVAPLGEREPERMLCLEVTGRASSHPSRHGLAAVAALGRVGPDSEHAMLQGTVEILAETQPHPALLQASGWTAVAGGRAIDGWESERVLFVEFDGPTPHTLMASVLDVGGVVVNKLAVLQPGAAASWEDLREDGEVPMPLSGQPAEEVLAELASGLRQTDMLWPRHDDEDFVALRSLAWARCRGHVGDWPEWEALPEEQRVALIEDFVATAGLPDDDVTRSLADLFLDYGDGYLTARPLGWSPGAVMLFLADWVPRKVALDAEQRAGLPEALRRWLRFALERRGVAPEWIEPVVAEVDASLPEFEEAFDDESSWGPAKAVAAELARRDVDLTDREAVDDAIRALNAEQLARRLTQE